jgi:tRNA 2-thiocytidine biosynthesis protein TtcA
MFREMQHIAPSQLGDTELFDFKNLEQKQLKMLAQRIDIVDAG